MVAIPGPLLGRSIRYQRQPLIVQAASRAFSSQLVVFGFRTYPDFCWERIFSRDNQLNLIDGILPQAWARLLPYSGSVGSLKAR